MSKILFYILIILILAWISFALRQRLGKNTKFFFSSLLVFFISLVGFIELKNAKRSDLRNEIVIAFNQGRSILCKDINVSNLHFNYEFGTGSFVSKDNKQNFNSLIIDIRDCRLNE